MARRNEKIKFAKPAFITFACLLVALIIMIVLAIPTSHEKISQKFMGSYEVEAENQGEEATTEYYDIGEDHVLTYVSFGKLKRLIKKDRTTYVLFGDCENVDFHLDAIEVNEAAKEKGIEKVYLLDSNTVSEDDLDYIQDYLREVNEDIKAVELMPTTDVWVFNNNKMINAASRSVYEPLSIYKKSVLHIFRY